MRYWCRVESNESSDACILCVELVKRGMLQAPHAVKRLFVDYLALDMDPDGVLIRSYSTALRVRLGTEFPADIVEQLLKHCEKERFRNIHKQD